MAEVVYGAQPFAEQIAFFRAKLSVPTQSWTDIFNEQHDRAFVVAGAVRDDLLADFRRAIDKAIAGGKSLDEFRKDFDRIVATHGWEYNGGRNWRSRVIYETNLAQSYRAGRWEQIQQIKQRRPFVRYRHQPNERYPRLEHLSWDGIVLHVDDPWLLTHFPQCAWGCQCWCESLAQRDIDRMGLKVTPPGGADDYVRARWAELQKDGMVPANADAPVGDITVTVGTRGLSPRTVTVPRGVDPGFAYVPGRTSPAFGNLAQAALGKAAQLPADIAAQSVDAALSIPRVANALDAQFVQFVDRVVSAGLHRGDSILVGGLSDDVVSGLKTAGIEPATAPIVVRDEQVLHALRNTKAVATTAVGRPKALTIDDFKELPALLRAPRAVLLDARSSTLIYVVDSDQREAAKLVVVVNFKTKIRSDDGRKTLQINDFRTASLIDVADIASQISNGVLQLLEGQL